jgi:hypothetical protein
MLNIEVMNLQRLGVHFEFLYENRKYPQMSPGKSDQRIEKESQDYWMCLNKTNEMGNSKFVLLIEGMFWVFFVQFITEFKAFTRAKTSS